MDAWNGVDWNWGWGTTQRPPHRSIDPLTCQNSRPHNTAAAAAAAHYSPVAAAAAAPASAGLAWPAALPWRLRLLRLRFFLLAMVWGGVGIEASRGSPSPVLEGSVYVSCGFQKKWAQPLVNDVRPANHAQGSRAHRPRAAPCLHANPSDLDSIDRRHLVAPWSRHWPREA